ncbi:MAG: cob(I)yrinic acid a,c-diamide adenosyltransferase [Bacillota bacterium]
MKQSYVHVYTGNGKGKTTAAAGLAVRAAGRGLCVKFVQFMKGRESGEVDALQRLGVEILRVSECKKFFLDMTEAEKTQARGEALCALPVIRGWLCSADLVVLDEAMAAIHCGILTENEVLGLIESRGGTELVLTGRDAPQRIIDAAHLVTEMREVKHYYALEQGARKGIEY